MSGPVLPAVREAWEAARAAFAYTERLIERVSAPYFRYDIECVGPDGIVKWRESIFNLVTTAGKNDLLTQYFKGSAYTAAFYVGLIDNASFSAIAAADTMSSHAGWVEAVPYSNGTRPSLTLGTPSAGSVDNSASKASYTINATARWISLRALPRNSGNTFADHASGASAATR